MKGLLNDSMEHRAERVFSGIPQFVSERSVCAVFPADLFGCCPPGVRWRFCASALRNMCVSREDKAAIVALMLSLPEMNIPRFNRELGAVIKEDASCVRYLFPSLRGRVAYCRAKLYGWRDVVVTTGKTGNPSWDTHTKMLWEGRLGLAKDELRSVEVEDVVRFATALSRAGNKPCKTLLVGLAECGKWELLRFLYVSFSECRKIWPLENMLLLLCAYGEINDSCVQFLDYVEKSCPGMIAKVRDVFGCNLLWQTLYRGQTAGQSGKTFPLVVKRLMDSGCNPHEENSFGLSWSDVANAQYRLGITKRSWDFWFDDAKGADFSKIKEVIISVPSTCEKGSENYGKIRA